MPAWSNQLPKQQKHMGFDIRRTPDCSAVQGIITCQDLLVCDTHFWGGRTIPCERQKTAPDGSLVAGDCPACREAVPYRTHVYVSVFDSKTQDHFLFECTAAAAKPLEAYKEATGTLRGCIMHAQRPKGFKNAKVVIQTNTANLARVTLPEPPNMILALSVIWRLPLTGLAIEDHSKQGHRAHAQSAPINRMRNQPDNQPEPQSMADILSGNGNGRHPVSPRA